MRPKTKVVCITGATGFVGRAILTALTASPNIVGEIRILVREKKDVGATVRVFSGDLYDPNILRAFLNGADVLIHAAAITDPKDQQLEHVNIDLTRTLVAVAASAKIQQFIYLSSENVTYHLQDHYSLSKKRAEEAVTQFKHSLILRPSIVFGRDDTRYVMQFARFVQKYPVIPVFPSHYSKVQPIHCTDLAHLVLRGIEYDLSGTYTLVGTLPLSFKDLGEAITRILAKKKVFVEVPFPLLRILISILTRFNSRYASMLSNALVVRNTNIASLEQTFHYTFPSFEARLRESLLIDIHRT